METVLITDKRFAQIVANMKHKQMKYIDKDTLKTRLTEYKEQNPKIEIFGECLNKKLMKEYTSYINFCYQIPISSNSILKFEKIFLIDNTDKVLEIDGELLK